MNFTDEIKANHRDLSQLARHFLEFMEASPNYGQHIEFEDKGKDLELFRERLQIWPSLLGAARLADFRRASIGLARLIKAIPERLFGNDLNRCTAFFGFDNPFLASLLLTPPNGISRAFSRCDFVLTGEGLRCLEVNMGPNTGGWQAGMWLPQFMEEEPFARIWAGQDAKPHYRDPVAAMLSYMVSDSRELAKSGVLNLGIADRYMDHEANVKFFENIYRQVLQADGGGLEGRVFSVSGSDDLRVKGAAIQVDGHPLHMMLELSYSNMPKEVFRSFKAGLINSYSILTQEFLSDKRLLALLSEHEESELFSPDERALIRDYVPWTRILKAGETNSGETSIPLPDHLIQARSEFVIKKGKSLGGKDILVGKYTEPATWKEGVDRALNEGDWIVQTFCPSLPYCYLDRRGQPCEHDVVWGMFAFGDIYGGGVARMVPRGTGGGVLNFSRGATLGIILEAP